MVITLIPAYLACCMGNTNLDGDNFIYSQSSQVWSSKKALEESDEKRNY